MPRVVFRRSDASAATLAEAEAFVAERGGSVIDRSDKTLLVDVARQDGVETLRSDLPGWVVSEQQPKIPIPDTRLKLRSGG